MPVEIPDTLRFFIRIRKIFLNGIFSLCILGYSSFFKNRASLNSIEILFYETPSLVKNSRNILNLFILFGWGVTLNGKAKNHSFRDLTLF